LWELLRALALLRERGTAPPRCLILGRLERIEPAKRLIKKLNIEDLIRFEGFKDPFPYLADCDLMVYPTRYDAFPDTALEALFTGCPVIAAAVGGLPDMLLYPDLLFESGDVREIAARIERCVKDPAFYAHIRGLCQNRASVYRFNWAQRFEEVMENYKKTVPPGPA
jgi:glycosyltransferase involved in cell wall biosynthesis